MLLDDPAFKAGIVSRIPLGRVGGTDDLTGAVALLLLGRRVVRHRPDPRHRRRPDRDPVADGAGREPDPPMEQRHGA